MKRLWWICMMVLVMMVAGCEKKYITRPAPAPAPAPCDTTDHEPDEDEDEEDDD